MPWRAVDDENGRWSFRVYGEADADTVLVLLPALPRNYRWSRRHRVVRLRGRTPAVPGDVLAISVEQDVLAPPTATEALLAKAPNARMTRRNYAASERTARPGAHFIRMKDQPGLAGIIARCATR